MRAQPKRGNRGVPVAALVAYAIRGIAAAVIAAGGITGGAVGLAIGSTGGSLHAAETGFGNSDAALPDDAPSRWAAGFEFVFAQPRFSDHVGLVQEEEDLAGNSRIQSLRFEHDFQLSPRTWIAYQTDSDIGLRGAWWQLDSEANTLAAQPPASGFGEISHPELADIDLSSVVPAERLAAQSTLELYAIDLEVTKSSRLRHWDLLFAAGL